MKQFLTLVLTCLPFLCFGAPTYTTYFNNTHTYTNATIAGTNFASRGVFTNSLSAAGFATSGTTNSTLIGNILANGGVFTNGITLGASGNLFGGANTIEQYNGATGQNFHLYNTRTDASNYERGFLRWSGGIFQIGTTSAGTGSAQALGIGTFGSAPMRIFTAANNRWEVTLAGNFVASTDNTYDIGARTSTRPQDGYFSGHILSMQLVEPKTADYVVLSSDSKAIFTNEGTTAIRNNTLPGATAGLTYTFIVQDTDGLTVTAAAGDTIRIANSVSAAAGNITTTTVGNSVTIVAVNATEWIATSVVGTWTVN